MSRKIQYSERYKNATRKDCDVEKILEFLNPIWGDTDILL